MIGFAQCCSPTLMKRKPSFKQFSERGAKFSLLSGILAGLDFQLKDLRLDWPSG